jgi:CRISPR-associated protein Csd1
MILAQLKEFADTQMDVLPAMYLKTSVAWLIDISGDGSFENVMSWKGDTKDTKRGQSVVAPHTGRTVGVKPKLLADTAEYVLGIAREGAKPERVADAHQQFKALVEKCAEVTQEESVRAIAHFLASPEAVQQAQAELQAQKGFDPGEVVTFRVAGIIPANAAEKIHSIEEFWAKYTAGGDDAGSKEPTPEMMCLVTGEIGPVVQRMPKLIKGLYGGQPSGTALVSANSKPFTSYGLQNSLTSPISRNAAEGFADALNYLMASEKNRRNIGLTTYVCWTRKLEAEFSPLDFLDRPDSQAVQNLLDSPFTGKQTHSLQGDQFYALALTASNARAVVRDWLETTVPRVQESLKQWFRDQAIVDVYGEPGRPLGIYPLTASAYRDPSKEMQPAVPTSLVRVALYGGRLPDDLLTRAVRRNRAEQDITYPRAALIKLVLTTQNRDAMTTMENLNPAPHLEDNDGAAYHCGRLLAELEAVQRAAIGKVNASLTDRYYGSASSTPATAFPPLLKLALTAHLPKLRRSSTGTFNSFDTRIQDITANLPSFPKTLNMKQQGLFALGYYHQRAANRSAAKAASQA